MGHLAYPVLGKNLTRSGCGSIAGKVSFLLPAFGSLNPDSLYLSIRSILSQKYPLKEVLVAEEHHGEPRFDDVARAAGATYYGYDSRFTGERYSVGRARNAILRLAEGEYVVMQDADIVIPDSEFLGNLTQELFSCASHFLATAPLRHIQKSEAMEWFERTGNTGDVYGHLSGLQLHDGFLLSNRPYEENEFIVVSHPYNPAKKDRRYVARRSLYREYQENPAKWSGREPLIFTPCVGKYFIAARTEHVLAVGGYCERYLGWGGEDGDLKWKLSCFLGCRHLLNDYRFSQVHLDHARPYFDQETYIKAKALSKSRQEQGLLRAIL
ncbi:MAG: glycosyltransferase, partial [Candidatus Micrarchaeota archaeon]